MSFTDHIDELIPIVVSVDSNYMPYLGVMLTSLLENANRKNYLDIIVLQNNSNLSLSESDFLKRNNRLLKEMIAEYLNVKLRIIDVGTLIGSVNFYISDHISVESYFRLFIPQLLSEYDKVVYLDADMIICADISELFAIDITDCYLAAARDIVISGAAKAPFYDKKEYIDSIGVNIYDYFQAGVLLLNVKKLAEDGLCEKMIQYAKTHELQYHDQDILNIFCKGKVKFLPIKWNVEIIYTILDIAKYAPNELYKEYMSAREDGFIYHFAGAGKPWHNPMSDYAELFWKYARTTPWYEYLIMGLVRNSAFVTAEVELRTWSQSLLDVVRIHDKSVDEFLKLENTDAVSVLQTALTKTKQIYGNYDMITSNKNIIFYGAGIKCRELLLYFAELDIDYPQVIWDRTANKGQHLHNIPVLKPDYKNCNQYKDSLIVITLENTNVSDAVKKDLILGGFDDSRIFCYQELLQVLTCKVWMKLNVD